MKRYFIFSLVISALFITSITAFGQSQLIFVETSQNAYEEGDTIVVSGNVTSIITDTPVLLQIFYEGNFVELAQIDVAQDGNYAHTILAQGPLWKKDGEYTVRVSYGTSAIETSFEFYSKQALIETTHTFDVDAGSYGTFDVDYTIRGATVKEMIVDSEIFALIVILETSDDGAITLKLPRESIDAKKIDTQDDTFIILQPAERMNQRRNGLPAHTTNGIQPHSRRSQAATRPRLASGRRMDSSGLLLLLGN